MTRLRAIWLIFIVTPFLLAASLRHSSADGKGIGPTDARVAGVPTPVLVELFTSESCSSCPPADALLAKLDRFQPVTGAQIVVVGEHVDYWDDTGWKDPYSSRQFSVRQSNYARQFRIEGPYTPQMVVDGATQLVGSDELGAIKAIESAAKVSKLQLSLTSIHLEGNEALAVHIEAGPLVPSASATPGQILVALADDSDQSNVRRGENAGRILTHVAVVRSLTLVGTLDRGSFSKEVRVKTENANLQNLRVIAIVQEAGCGRVLGVGSSRLSN